jgi:hypothetical protein
VRAGAAWALGPSPLHPLARDSDYDRDRLSIGNRPADNERLAQLGLQLTITRVGADPDRVERLGEEWSSAISRTGSSKRSKSTVPWARQQ